MRDRSIRACVLRKRHADAITGASVSDPDSLCMAYNVQMDLNKLARRCRVLVAPRCRHAAPWRRAIAQDFAPLRTDALLFPATFNNGIRNARKRLTHFEISRVFLQEFKGVAVFIHGRSPAGIASICFYWRLKQRLHTMTPSINSGSDWRIDCGASGRWPPLRRYFFFLALRWLHETRKAKSQTL